MSVSGLWDILRSADFHEEIGSPIIFENAPTGINPKTVQPVQTAHYAVFRVDSEEGESHIVRVGVASSSDTAPADNSGYLKTSAVSPVGQPREYELAKKFAAAGASVVVPSHYVKTNEFFDLLWLPYLESDDQEISAENWVKALTQLWKYEPTTEIPVFTSRIKTLARIEAITNGSADGLQEKYDEQMEELFTVATRWSVIHGDAHGGNAISKEGSPLLIDFDTACWAPSVWDFTHLLNRAGNPANKGFTKEEMLAAVPFDEEEINAAMALRSTASEVAKLYREFTSKDRMRKEKLKRMKNRKKR